MWSNFNRILILLFILITVSESKLSSINKKKDRRRRIVLCCEKQSCLYDGTTTTRNDDITTESEAFIDDETESTEADTESSIDSTENPITTSYNGYLTTNNSYSQSDKPFSYENTTNTNTQFTQPATTRSQQTSLTITNQQSVSSSFITQQQQLTSTVVSGTTIHQQQSTSTVLLTTGGPTTSTTTTVPPICSSDCLCSKEALLWVGGVFDGGSTQSSGNWELVCADRASNFSFQEYKIDTNEKYFPNYGSFKEDDFKCCGARLIMNSAKRKKRTVSPPLIFRWSNVMIETTKISTATLRYFITYWPTMYNEIIGKTLNFKINYVNICIATRLVFLGSNISICSFIDTWLSTKVVKKIIPDSELTTTLKRVVVSNITHPNLFYYRDPNKEDLYKETYPHCDVRHGIGSNSPTVEVHSYFFVNKDLTLTYTRDDAQTQCEVVCGMNLTVDYHKSYIPLIWRNLYNPIRQPDVNANAVRVWLGLWTEDGTRYKWLNAPGLAVDQTLWGFNEPDNPNKIQTCAHGYFTRDNTLATNEKFYIASAGCATKHTYACATKFTLVNV